MEKMGRLTYKDQPGYGQASRERLSCKAKSLILHRVGGETNILPRLEA